MGEPDKAEKEGATLAVPRRHACAPASDAPQIGCSPSPSVCRHRISQFSLGVALLQQGCDEDGRAALNVFVKMEWPQYLDRNGAIARLFQVRPIPTYVLIDREGIVRETQSGWSPTVDGWLSSKVNKYLKAIPE